MKHSLSNEKNIFFLKSKAFNFQCNKCTQTFLIFYDFRCLESTPTTLIYISFLTSDPKTLLTSSNFIYIPIKLEIIKIIFFIKIEGLKNIKKLLSFLCEFLSHHDSLIWSDDNKGHTSLGSRLCKKGSSCLHSVDCTVCGLHIWSESETLKSVS